MHKACFTAQGLKLIPGIDNTQTHSHVCKYAMLRSVLSAAAHDDWYLHQFAVKTAFLNSPIEEEV